MSLPFVQVDIGLLAHQVGIASADTLDLGQGVHDLLFPVDVGVEKTKDELEVALLGADQSYPVISNSSWVLQHTVNTYT
jgi:hypothetical protein